MTEQTPYNPLLSGTEGLHYYRGEEIDVEPTIKSRPRGRFRTRILSGVLEVIRMYRNFPSTLWHNVALQLQGRREFIADAWVGHGDPEEVVWILKLIADGMEWPNSNFIPSDPLDCVLVDRDDRFSIAEFLAELDESGVCYAQEDLDQMHGWTLGQFVEDVLKRRSARTNSQDRT